MAKVTSIEMQKNIICNTMAELIPEDIQDLFDFVNTLVKRELINTHGMGSSLNLDLVPDDIVSEIYEEVLAVRVA